MSEWVSFNNIGSIEHCCAISTNSDITLPASSDTSTIITCPLTDFATISSTDIFSISSDGGILISKSGYYLLSASLYISIPAGSGAGIYIFDSNGTEINSAIYNYSSTLSYAMPSVLGGYIAPVTAGTTLYMKGRNRISSGTGTMSPSHYQTYFTLVRLGAM